METWARERCEALEEENLCGYIFKSKSPSSGMARVKVFANGVPSPIGVGVFVLSGLLTLALALLSVGYQSIRAARANPVVSLKYE